MLFFIEKLIHSYIIRIYEIENYYGRIFDVGMQSLL